MQLPIGRKTYGASCCQLVLHCTIVAHMTNDDLVDTTEACELLGGLHRSTLSRWVQLGRIVPAKRVGRSFLFRRSDVLALLADAA